MNVPTVFGYDGKGVLHPESFGGDGIICHGPLVKQDEMTMAMRVVIHEDEKAEFAVHYQCFPNFPDLKGSYFHEGGYPGTNLARAVQLFAERSATFARGCGNLTEPTPEPV